MRFALLLLCLALLPAYAPAVDLSLCKPGYFAQLTQRYLPSFVGQLKRESAPAAAVRAMAESNFTVPGLSGRQWRDDWIEWSELRNAQHTLLESLPSLTAAERAELIPLVRSVHPEDIAGKQLRKLILLGLYDRNTWAALTTAIYEGSLFAHLGAKYLPAVANGLPADLRHEFLEAIGDRYHSYTKERMFRRADTAPKRLADHYFKHLLRGDELIQAGFKNGRTPREAFGAYIAKVQQYIPGDDHYTAEQALGMMEEVRKALRKKMADGPVSDKAEEPVLWVGGSLPNGRATFLESDIDIGTNVELVDHVKAKIEDSVKAYVAAVRPDAGIHAAIKRGLDGAFWTRKHPVAFRIRPSGIDLVVVNPSGEMDMRPIR